MILKSALGKLYRFGGSPKSHGSQNRPEDLLLCNDRGRVDLGEQGRFVVKAAGWQWSVGLPTSGALRDSLSMNHVVKTVRPDYVFHLAAQTIVEAGGRYDGSALAGYDERPR